MACERGEPEPWPATMYYVYILQSKKNRKLYIGHTLDLRKRLKEHNEGKSKSTKPNRPFELIYYCAFKNQEDALACEKYFKTTAGWKRIKRMLVNTFSEK